MGKAKLGQTRTKYLGMRTSTTTQEGWRAETQPLTPCEVIRADNYAEGNPHKNYLEQVVEPNELYGGRNLMRHKNLVVQ